MKKLLVAAVLLMSSVFSMAEPVVTENAEQAKAVVASKCEKACLILDENDVAVLSAQIDAALEQAYKAGVAGWSKEAALGQ